MGSQVGTLGWGGVFCAGDHVVVVYMTPEDRAKIITRSTVWELQASFVVLRGSLEECLFWFFSEVPWKIFFFFFCKRGIGESYNSIIVEYGQQAQSFDLDDIRESRPTNPPPLPTTSTLQNSNTITVYHARIISHQIVESLFSHPLIAGVLG